MRPIDLPFPSHCQFICCLRRMYTAAF